MISKATQYLHLQPGIYSFISFYIHMYPDYKICPYTDSSKTCIKIYDIHVNVAL